MEQRYERVKKTPEDVIFGVRAVIEAIKADRVINKILIQKGMNKELFNELKDALKGKNYPLQFVPVQPQFYQPNLCTVQYRRSPYL